MSKIHCAIGDVPNGKRRGTQKECLDKGQVRYYGIKHIDKSLIKPKTGKKEKSKDELKQLELAGQLGAINGKINSLSWKYKQQPNPDKKAILKEEGLKLIAESEAIKKKFDEISEKIKKTKEKEKKREEKEREKLIQEAKKDKNESKKESKKKSKKKSK